MTQAVDVADAARVAASLGAPTILVNNAGVQGPLGPIGTIDADAWWETQAIHVLGALRTTTALLPGMIAGGGGRIVNIVSQAGTFVAPNASAYAVAKASLIRLTEHLDAERRGERVRAFALQPGTILTDMATQTLASSDARTYAAPLVELLESVTQAASDAAMTRLCDHVVGIATGRHDALAGRYLDVDWDWNALATESGR